MLEKLRDLKFVLGLLTGKSDAKTIKKKMLAEYGNGSEADMSDSEKKEFNEAVEGMQALGGIFTEVVTFQAQLVKKYFDALKSVGFNDEQALALAAAGKGIVTGNVTE